MVDGKAIVQTTNLVLIMGMLIGSLLFVLMVGFKADRGGDVFATAAKKNFDRVLKNVTGIPLLRPIVVSVYQRKNWIDLGVDAKENIYDTNTYDERLLVIKPNNWIIYTPDGITFHYVVNDTNRSSAASALSRRVCSNVEHLDAVKYTLQPIGDKSRYASIKYSCIQYTMDELIRVFAITGNRTDLDLTKYFDSRENSDAPRFTVENVLEFVIVNGYV